jgi:hypothetical protein
MKMSRRNFMGAAAGVGVATLCSFRTTGLNAYPSRPGRDLDCVLLDLSSNCVLPESLRGYQSVLADEHQYIAQAEFDRLGSCRMVIVPGFGAMDAVIARTLSGLLQAGTNVLLESGAAFLRASEFTAHQKMMNRYFGITIGSPVDLWSTSSADHARLTSRRGQHSRTRPTSRESVPYVNYRWPQETSVRDFSRVIPVLAREGSVIGKVGVLSIALSRRMGKGTLVFLGSPIGPALLAGDPEARSWLRSVTHFEWKS